MKKVTKMMLLILVILGSTAFAQSTSKVIVVLNHASWCSICKANGTRALEVFNTNNTDKIFELIANDISDETTRAVAKPAIKTAGLEQTSQQQYAAGIFSFYDAKTKKLLAQVSVAHSNEEILKTMESAKANASK